MKTTDKLILISALAYGILFYQQDFGVNFLIYSIIQLIGLYVISDKEKRNKNWWLSFVGVSIAAIGVFLYGSFLSVFANITSLCVLAVLTIDSRTSIFICIIQSAYSVLTGVVHILSSVTSQIINPSQENKVPNRFKNSMIFLVSLVIVIIFFALYRGSNEAFKNFTNQIDWSFISLGWLSFTLLGYYLMYQLYHLKRIEKLSEYDINSPNNLSKDYSEIATEKMMSSDTESKWAKTLLIMLNLLLVFVLLVDVFYFLGVYKIEGEIDYSANVHQGVDALIFSIVLAVSIILFFFKGRLNFIKENRVLKLLAMGWIIQNAILVIFTGYKNFEYIQEFFLTYKRIGVFVYLTCCLVGLTYTYLKISQVKTNWFLVRKVGWSLYALSIISPIINWDALIINYNFSAAKNTPENLDLSYLMELPKVNYVLIQKHLHTFEGSYNSDIVDELSEIEFYKNEYQNSDWRSFNVRKHLAFK